MTKRVNIEITAENKQFDKTIAATQNSLGSLDKSFGRLSAGGVALGTILGNVLVGAFRKLNESMDSAIKRVDTMNNFPKVMTNLGLSAGDGAKAVGILSEKLLGLPTALDEGTKAVQRLASANGNIEASTAIFLAMNNAILAGGAATTEQAVALEQMLQAYAKGKFDYKEWLALLQTMPAQLKQIAQAMGYVDPEQLRAALNNGTVSMNDFMKKMVELNNTGLNGFSSFEEQARASTNGIETSIKNLQTAITRAMSSIIDAIGQSNIAAFFSNIAKAIGAVVPYVVAFVKVIGWAVQGIAQLFGGASNAAAAVDKSVGKLSDSLAGASSGAGGISDGLDNANASAKKLTNTLAKFDEMNVLKESTAEGGGGSTGGAGVSGIDMGGLWDSVSEGGDKATEIAEKIKTTIEGVWNELSKSQALQSFVGAYKTAFDAISINARSISGSLADMFSSTFGAINKTAQKFGKRLDGQFAKMYDGIGRLWESLINAMAAPLVGFLGGFSSQWKTSAQIVTDSIATIAGSFAENWGKINTGLSETINTIIPNIQEGFSNLGGTFALMLEDMFTAGATWLPQIFDKFGEFFTNINEGLFKPMTEQIGTIWVDFTKSIKENWDKYGASILNGIGEFINGAIEWFNKVYSEILDPIIKPFLEEFARVWEENLKPAVDAVIGFIGKLIDGALAIWNGFIHPIIMWITEKLAPIFVGLGNTVGGVVNSILGFIGGLASGIFTALGGIIDFITGVFTLNWGKAWEGVSNVFKGIIDGLVAIFKFPINLIIDAINGFTSGVNAIKIPDWVPFVGGAGFSIPKIPKLATGGVIDRATLAMLGERGQEVVMPLENNTGWIDNLAGQINALMGSNQPIIIKIGEETILETVIDGINARGEIKGRNVIRV